MRKRPSARPITPSAWEAVPATGGDIDAQNARDRIVLRIENPTRRGAGWRQTWDGDRVRTERCGDEDTDLADWGGSGFARDADRFREGGDVLALEFMVDALGGTGFGVTIERGPPRLPPHIGIKLAEAFDAGARGEEIDALARELVPTSSRTAMRAATTLAPDCGGGGSRRPSIASRRCGIEFTRDARPSVACGPAVASARGHFGMHRRSSEWIDR